MKTSLVLLGLAALLTTTVVGCGDKVADSEALYQEYLKDDAARVAKVKECKLLSLDDQSKSQACTIAFKADADKQLKKRGLMDLKPVDLSPAKQPQ